MSKNRYWSAVCYPENMVQDWQIEIGELLQLPYCYCVHDKDIDSNTESRKVHVHIILVFPNTTTYKHAFSVFERLNSAGLSSFNKIEPIINIRYMYNYLIHDTETCVKKGKFLYNTAERVYGNNFDIGSYEQVSLSEKYDVCKEICNLIIQQNFTNFADFYMYIASNYDDTLHFEIVKSYSNLFNNIIKGNYLKGLEEKC